MLKPLKFRGITGREEAFVHFYSLADQGEPASGMSPVGRVPVSTSWGPAAVNPEDNVPNNGPQASA